MNGESQNNNNTHNDINIAINARTVIIFAACVTVLLFISRVDAIKQVVEWIVGMLMPVFIGVTLAYIINPLTVLFENLFLGCCSKIKKMKQSSRKSISRGISIVLSLFVLILVIALLMFLIIPEFVESLMKLINSAPSLIEDASVWFSDLMNTDNPFVLNLGQYVGSLVDSLTQWFTSDFSSLVESLVSVISESVMSVVSFVFDFIIAVVVLVYALLEKDKFRAQSKKFLYAVFSRTVANDILQIARYGNDVFGKFISGKLLTSTIVGLVTFLFMAIAGMPYALLSAGIIAITNIIPFFGPFIGGIPTAFFVLITDLRQGIIYVIFLVVLQQIEGNIIEPMIMEDKTGVSKFWIIFALLLCGGVFGVAGMIFSVPLFAVLFYTINLYVNRALIKKDLPVPSETYLNIGSVEEESGELLPPPAKAPPKKVVDAIREWKTRIMDDNEAKPIDKQKEKNNPK